MEHSLDEKLDNLITLWGESGQELTFVLLDLIEYEGEEYMVLLPQDDQGDDTGEVVVLRLDEEIGENEKVYSGVDDQDTLNALFDIFVEKHPDLFPFD